MNGTPRIVFCTTCRGRAGHIKQTLPKNLADNRDPNSRFVLLNYNSPDDLLDYLVTNHKPDIKSGKLTVYSYDAPDGWHIAHAKNMAARLGIAQGADIYVTLDADNFTGPDFDRFIASKMSEPGVCLQPDFALIHSMPWTPERPLRGFAGRLVIRAQDFLKMGGYDEMFKIWGCEDIDLYARLRRLNYTMRFIDNCYLHTIPHGPDVRFKEYPEEAPKNERKQNSKWIDRRPETVVNAGKFGLGTVVRNFDPEPIEIKPVPTRVFGIGLHRTATYSLHKAFQILGFDSLHWGQGEAPMIWQEMSAIGRSKTLERFYSLCDLPIPLLYRELDKAYPGSKFILTIRDEAKWIKSVERLWSKETNPMRWTWDVYPISNTLHYALYGNTEFDGPAMLERYREHNAEVKEYFKNRPGDLLVMDMECRAGWPELCLFLDLDCPHVPYPWECFGREVRHECTGSPLTEGPMEYAQAAGGKESP